MTTTEVTETTEATDTRLTVLRSHDVAIAKLQPALQYDITTDPKAVDRARKDAKQVRCGIEAARKKLVEDAVTWQREVNAVAKDITARVTPIEEHCERIEAEHAAEKKRKAEEAAKAEKERIRAARKAEAEGLPISERGKKQVMAGLLTYAIVDTPEEWQAHIAAALKIDAVIADEDAAAAAREAEEARLKAEREELARQRAEIEAERKRLADEQARQRVAEFQKKLADEEAARKIVAAEAAERAKRIAAENAKHQQERNAANVKANETLLQFVKAVHLIRPTPKSADIGPQLEAIIERAIEDMAAYFHDHLRDHYDARKDV
jgi:hypothetical protein